MNYELHFCYLVLTLTLLLRSWHPGMVDGFVPTVSNQGSFRGLHMTFSPQVPMGFPSFSDLQTRKGQKGRSSSKVQRVYETWNWEYQNRIYSINYRVEGQGPPILLIHGFGANLNHFRNQFSDLVNAGYKVYAMDLLGFGASEKPIDAHTIGFSIELFSQQMIDFIKAQNQSKPWVLAGNSIGGLCSLYVAAQTSRRLDGGSSTTTTTSSIDIAAVVLFNSSGGMTGFRYQDLPIWAHPIMGHTQYFLFGGLHGPLIFNTIAQRAVIQFILTQTGIYKDINKINDELMEILLEPASDVGAAQVFLAVFSGPPGPTREELLPLIQVPVLAFWGSDDPFTPLDDSVKALPTLHGTKDLTLQILENTGHCLHDEKPEIVNPKMIAFLKERCL